MRGYRAGGCHRATRRRVPWLQLQFPEPADPPAGEVAHVQRRRPVAPDRLPRENERAEIFQVGVGGRLHVIGEPGRKQGLAQVFRGGYGDPLAVAERPSPGCRREQLREKRVENRSRQRLSAHPHPSPRPPRIPTTPCPPSRLPAYCACILSPAL